MCNGLNIDGYKTSKAKAKILKIDKKKNTSVVELIIHEGKNHQVKKMFEAVGYDVLKLKRWKIGGLVLDKKLMPGQSRRQIPRSRRKSNQRIPIFFLVCVLRLRSAKRRKQMQRRHLPENTFSYSCRIPFCLFHGYSAEVFFKYALIKS